MRSSPRSAPSGALPSARSSSGSGFTLIEVLVSLAVMVVVLVVLLTLLGFSNRVAKAQVNVAEMQQSLRVAQNEMVRDIRMAGRGGLPTYRPASAVPLYPGMFLPAGPSISVVNNVPAGTRIGGEDDATVVAGTDILTLRGVFSTTFYQVNPLSDGQVPNTGNGAVIVRDISPTGVPQSTAALAAAIASNRPEALLLVSSLDDRIQAVVELTGGAPVAGGVQLNFTTAGTHGAAYLGLSPNGQYPAELTAVAAVGILEEYRYYVRDVELGPRLSRARLYPGTNAPYAGNATNLHVDVADNILDLQLALGIDRNANQTIDDTGNDVDDWLFNSSEPADKTEPPEDWNDSGRPLYYVRITTLARSDRADPEYLSPPIEAIEDHVYDEPETPALDDRLERAHRRRILRSVVDLRNLS